MVLYYGIEMICVLYARAHNTIIVIHNTTRQTRV